MDSVVTYPSCSSSFTFKLSISSTPSLFYSPFSFLKLNSYKKLKTTPISVSFNNNPNPQKPNSLWQKYTSPIKPFSTLISISQTIKLLAEKTSLNKWVYAFRGYNDADSIPDGINCNYLENGGFGMALLSVTSTAKVRISPFVATLAANPTFVSGFFAWVIAQSMKVFLNFCFERKWDLRIMCASGGMPSSHSALCMALTTSVAICHGVADSLFPVCLGFSLIVMYDAIGVRRHAGMQAEVLNLIVEDLFEGHPISKRKLKELLGHTPSQVVAGAVLGMLVACICCQGCFVAI